MTRTCCRCGKATEHPTSVGEVEAASGPGWTQYACPQCAHHYGPLTTPRQADEHVSAQCRLGSSSPEYAMAHEFCPGNSNVRVGGVVAIRYRCACVCHQAAEATPASTVERERR